MIPFEIITMLGSGIFSGVMTLLSKSMDAKRSQNEMMMQALGAQNAAWNDARNAHHLSFTRRTIAILSVLSIIVLPKVAALVWPDVQVTVGYTEFHPGFWFLTDGRNVVEWVTASGLTITPLDTNLVAAIVGLYFGHKVAK